MSTVLRDALGNFGSLARSPPVPELPAARQIEKTAGRVCARSQCDIPANISLSFALPRRKQNEKQYREGLRQDKHGHIAGCDTSEGIAQ